MPQSQEVGQATPDCEKLQLLQLYAIWAHGLLPLGVTVAREPPGGAFSLLEPELLGHKLPPPPAQLLPSLFVASVSTETIAQRGGSHRAQGLRYTVVKPHQSPNSTLPISATTVGHPWGAAQSAGSSPSSAAPESLCEQQVGVTSFLSNPFSHWSLHFLSASGHETAKHVTCLPPREEPCDVLQKWTA